MDSILFLFGILDLDFAFRILRVFVFGFVFMCRDFAFSEFVVLDLELNLVFGTW